MSANYVGVLERGLKLPTLDTLAKLAKALDVGLTELLEEPRDRDVWIDEVATVAAGIPRAQRPTALAVLKAIASAR